MTTADKLLESLERSLADIAEALEQAKAIGVLETALADAIEAIERRPGVDLGPLVAALREWKPVINVQVPPPPAPVVHLMPAAKAEWEIRLPGSYGAPDRVLTIKKVA